MKKPVEMKLEGSRQISGQPGDKFPLSAKLLPEDVTLPQVFWRSTNPDIASVDENGVVTIHADIEEMVTMSDNDDIPETSCKIIAESLYADGPVAEVEIIRQSSGVENVGYATPLENETLRTSPVEVYNLSGLRIADSTDNLSPGIYIVRRGNTVNKTAVK